MKRYCPKCGEGYDASSVECSFDGSPLRSPEDSEDPLVGELIGGCFRLLEVIGEGGMGLVYRAIQRPIGRHVAVKVIPDHSRTEVSLDRFFREARLASDLTHPNVVRPVDFGEDASFELVYFAMELVPGPDLQALVDDRALDMPLALEVVHQVCGALTDTHDQGIIHRDLKPRNLKLVPVSDGSVQVKVLDLGIARPVDDQRDLTETGHLAGTPWYMAPEYVREGELDHRADLYAVGVMLYEMLCGGRPFVGNSAQILLQHVQADPPPLRVRAPAEIAIPPSVESLYRDLMAKRPDRRCQGARAVRERVDGIRQQCEFEPIRCERSDGGPTIDTFEPWLVDVPETRHEREPEAMPLEPPDADGRASASDSSSSESTSHQLPDGAADADASRRDDDPPRSPSTATAVIDSDDMLSSDRAAREDSSGGPATSMSSEPSEPSHASPPGDLAFGETASDDAVADDPASSDIRASSPPLASQDDGASGSSKDESSQSPAGPDVQIPGDSEGAAANAPSAPSSPPEQSRRRRPTVRPSTDDEDESRLSNGSQLLTVIVVLGLGGGGMAFASLGIDISSSPSASSASPPPSNRIETTSAQASDDRGSPDRTAPPFASDDSPPSSKSVESDKRRDAEDQRDTSSPPSSGDVATTPPADDTEVHEDIAGRDDASPEVATSSSREPSEPLDTSFAHDPRRRARPNDDEASGETSASPSSRGEKGASSSPKTVSNADGRSDASERSSSPLPNSNLDEADRHDSSQDSESLDMLLDDLEQP